MHLQVRVFARWLNLPGVFRKCVEINERCMIWTQHTAYFCLPRGVRGDRHTPSLEFSGSSMKDQSMLWLSHLAVVATTGVDPSLLLSRSRLEASTEGFKAPFSSLFREQPMKLHIPQH